jgi:hypothetical protein
MIKYTQDVSNSYKKTSNIRHLSFALWRLILIGCFIFASNGLFAQLEADSEFQKIIDYGRSIDDGVDAGQYYTHSLNFNTTQKEWLGIKGYRETINCYFKISETKEVELVKVVVILQKEGEQAIKSFVYSEDQRPIMCYNTFIKNDEMVGNQGGYFGKGTIVALSVNDSIVIGDNLTDEMVNAARDMYLDGERYRQLLEKVMSLQSQ